MADCVVPVKIIETGGPDQNIRQASQQTLGHPLRVQRGGKRIRLTTAPLPKEQKAS